MYSRMLAEWIAAATIDDLPETAVTTAKIRLGDGIAILASGATTRAAEVGRAHLPLLHGTTSVGNYAAYPSFDRQWQLDDAAFLLGTYAFSENYADTSLLSIAHPGSVVVPPLLLAAQERPISGDEALLAVAVGYQVCEAVTRALNNTTPRLAYQLHGFQPTAQCGVFGAVAVLAKLRELDVDETARSLEIACNYACGLTRHSGGPRSSLRVHSGEAVRHAVVALTLAQAGLDGDAEMFEGRCGFLSAYRVGELDETALREFGSRYLVEEVHLKMHCTAHTLATALDAALSIRRQHDFDVADIERIEVRVPEAHAAISPPKAPDYGDANAPIKNNYAHCVAVVLVSGDYLWPDAVEEGRRDPAVQALAARIEVVADARLTDVFERDRTSWPASVEVTVGGEVLRSSLREPEGRGATARKIAETKLTRLLGRAFGPAPARATRDLLERVRDSSDIWADLSETANASAAQVAANGGKAV